MFSGCGLITGELDGDIFITNTNLANCNGTFYGTKFTSVGANLLSTNSKIYDIRNMLRDNNKATGNAPKLWEILATQTSQCFAGCTFDDQDDIPITYK